MRRVLVVSYDFPPRRTSAVYRVTNLTKYLCKQGWQPTVLTIEGNRGDAEDPRILQDFPAQIRVVRISCPEISGWEESAGAGIRALGGLRSTGGQRRQPAWDRWIRSAGNFVRSCLYFPDDTVAWVIPGLAKAIELHLQHRFDAVYTTSPPRSGPVIGLFLKVLLGIPWVAEFRDPWYPPPQPWRQKLERALLQRILHHADRIVVISRGNAQDMERSHGVSKRKVEVISNGYDEKDFDSLDGERSPLLEPGYFHLSHFGTVYPHFSGRFFDALRSLLVERPELRDRLRVNIIGFPDDTVQHYATRGDLQGIVRIFGFVPHDEALRAMRRSDCLLVFLGNRDVARLSGLGKIYDYLRIGRPVFAVAFEGGTQELVEEAQAGWVANPEDPEAIKRVLKGVVLNGGGAGNPRPVHPEFVEQFRYDRLAGKLAEVLNATVGHGK